MSDLYARPYGDPYGGYGSGEDENDEQYYAYGDYGYGDDEDWYNNAEINEDGIPVCPVCKRPYCQRLSGKKQCTSYASSYEKGMLQEYYDKDFMLSDMANWAAKETDPISGTHHRYMNYVEASGYVYADGTYAVHIDSGNTATKAITNIEIINEYPVHTVTGKVITAYYHTHYESAQLSSGDGEGNGDEEIARKLSEYGVPFYILFEGVPYLVG